MSQKSEHYIGFLPQFEKPYWGGYCDIDKGYENYKITINTVGRFLLP